MTVINKLILSLNSLPRFGRKRITTFFNDNIKINELSSNIEDKKILEELYPKILKQVPDLTKELFYKNYLNAEIEFNKMIDKKVRITNIFEHRYKFGNWDGDYYPEGMDDDEEWTV